MKYLKMFEDRNKDYEYLDKEDEQLLKDYIEPVIYKYFDEKINKLDIYDYDINSFNYRYVLDSIFDMHFYDKLYRSNILKGDSITLPKISNSFNSILDIVINDTILDGYKTNVYTRIERRLKDIFESDHELYKNYYKSHNDEISANIKDDLKYIIDSEEYNL